MALELKQHLKLTQQLVMTPQLQQAIKLLQLSTLELANVVQQELVENPCLEETVEEEPPNSRNGTELNADGSPVDPDSSGKEASASEAAEAEPREPSSEEVVGDVDWENYMESRPHTSMANSDVERPPLEDGLSIGDSLADHLLWQLGFADLDDLGKQIGTLLIGNLDENGYLVEEVSAIAEVAGVECEDVERVLKRIQSFDPVGAGGRNLSECLMVQANFAHIDDPLVLKIIQEHLDLLQRKDFRGIARIEDVGIEEVAAAARVIGSFEPRPGRQFADEEPVYITPDIFVHKIGDEYHVVLNEDGMPKLRVSSAYRSVLSRENHAVPETRDYVREKLRSAIWLIKSIHQRQRTIVKVMESIIRFQRDFFDRGAECLRPLNLRDVAEDIGMHESTVSRVTTCKYVQTPHGVFELKYFFNSSIRTTDGNSIASESVKEKIREIIRNENSRKPLSDQRIARILRDAEIHIARRTVTKYREALRILSSTRRREIG